MSDEAWRLRFWSIFLGQALSLVGSAITQFVLLWWITDKTGSAAALATAGMAMLLPQAVLGPLGGVFADRHDRQIIVILTDLVSALCVLLLIMMFPAILSMIALYNMISDVGQILPGIGLNTLNGYCLALMGGSLGQVWLIKGTFDTIPKELDEAAIIDGCTHWQVFRIILLPTLKPILATTFLLSFVGIISDFLLGSILLTDNSKKTLAVGLYGLLSGDRSNNLGLFAAGAVLTMIPVIALFQYLQKYIVGGATSGAVKG